MTHPFTFACMAAFALFLPQATVHAQIPSGRSLSDISLEDLMNIQVTSVSRKDESLSKVASAIYVIDSEEIHRSGATNIPDLLRMVPGVNVAQINAHVWAISIRGFNERFTRSVLVLIDGRSVYSPLTGGVNWDQQDVPLEEIDRIEVIRGPGGTIWGANAVNGVINITTRSAQATKGGLLVVGGGNPQTARTLLQYGDSIGGGGAFRAYANYVQYGSSPSAEVTGGADRGHILHLGFRSDWTLKHGNSLMIRADLSEMGADQTAGNPIAPSLLTDGTYQDRATVLASDVVAKWHRTLSATSDISLQVYFDRYNRLDTNLREIRNTVDVDFSQHRRVGARHDLVWGFGYRNTSDDIASQAIVTLIAYIPPRQSDNLFNVFLQDSITLTDTLSLTIGSKLEHNGYTGFEYEPGAQLVWRPNSRQELWTSVSRAIRQPTRTDEGFSANSPFTLPSGAPAVITLSGDPDASAATLRDFEIGYRIQASKTVSLDIVTFLSHYNNLLTAEPGTPFLSAEPDPRLVIPQQFANLSHALSYGGEIAATWNVTSRWKLSPAYSAIHIIQQPDPGSLDTTARARADDTPQHQIQVRSSLNTTHHVEWDGSFLYVSALRGASALPAYTRFDMRVAKRIGETLEISLVGQNLLRARHLEFPNAEGLVRTFVARRVFGQLTWRF